MLIKESIEVFCKQAIDLLSEPAATDVPVVSPYSAEEMPDLLVHMGALERLPEIREQLPESSFLLGIHYGDAIDEWSCGGRTLYAAIGDSLDYVTKAGFLTSLLPGKRVRLVAEPGFKEAHFKQWEQVHKAIKTAMDNAVSEERRGLIRLRAACCNLRQMLTGVGSEPNLVAKDVPAVLCGAGPSLAMHLDLLKGLQGRIVIVAVGHAVRTLEGAGIKADFIVEGDALAGRNWPSDLMPDSVLVATAEVAPEVARRFERVVWCAGSSFAFNGVVSRFGVPLFAVTLDRTVSVHALDFMLRMGFRQIALLGQDYCLGENGRLYAEESKVSESDAISELPAASGEGVVLADHSLMMLRDAINGYLDGVGNTPDLKLVNVSGGAQLNRTNVLALSDWAEQNRWDGELPRLFSERESHVCTSLLSELAGAVEEGAVAVDSVLESCKQLKRELDRYPIKIERVRRRQLELQQAMGDETVQRAQSICSSWFNALMTTADRVMKETPGMMTDEPDPQRQLHYLNSRYRMSRRLYSDLLSCLCDQTDPHASEAFRAENMASLVRSNRAFADLVRQVDVDSEDQFDIHWINQMVPYVQRRVKDEWVELSGCISIFKEAVDVVDRFVLEQQFDSQRDSLTVVAPGNWVYVLEFIRRFPSMELAVIEPWPTLLAQIIRRGCFLHKMPENYLVINTWADPAYIKQRNDWQERGLRRLTFVSPHVAQMRDVQVLSRNLGLLN